MGEGLGDDLGDDFGDDFGGDLEGICIWGTVSKATACMGSGVLGLRGFGLVRKRYRSMLGLGP